MLEICISINLKYKKCAFQNSTKEIPVDDLFQYWSTTRDILHLYLRNGSVNIPPSNRGLFSAQKRSGPCQKMKVSLLLAKKIKVDGGKSRFDAYCIKHRIGYFKEMEKKKMSYIYLLGIKELGKFD